VVVWYGDVIYHRSFPIKAERLICSSFKERKQDYCDRPGEANAPAVAAVVPEDPRGDDLAEGLQHVLQLFLVHREGQVGDVQIGGVLLLLLL